MFNTTRFLRENFVDIDGVLHLIAKHYGAAAPQRAAVAKWFQRKAIPGEWFPLVLMVLEAEHGHHDLEQYVRRPAADDIFA